MSFDVLEEVNYLAAIVAAVAWFVAGAIWYAPPVLGKAWMRAGGIEMPEGFRPNPLVFVGTFVAYLVTAIAMAMLARATGSTTFGDGIVLGLVTGVGFALALTAIGVIYDRKPQPGAWFALNGLFNLIGFVLVAVIVTVWE
jgi:Protein of unknown function (DUF1761)